MIENNAFAKKEADNENLPPTSNKWRLLSATSIMELLEEITEKSEKLRSLKGKQVDLLCFLLNAEAGSAIYSKKKSVLMRACLDRVAQTGRSIDDIDVDESTGSIDWPKSGYFKLEDRAAGRHLVSRGGSSCSLPDELAGPEHEWTLVHNENYRKASLKSSLVSVLCTQIFSTQAVELISPPELLNTVVERHSMSPRTPSDQVRRMVASPASTKSAASTSSGTRPTAASPVPSLPSGYGGSLPSAGSPPHAAPPAGAPEAAPASAAAPESEVAAAAAEGGDDFS